MWVLKTFPSETNLEEDIKEVSYVVFPALGHLLDLLTAEVEPLLEAVEADLRKRAVQLRVELAKFFVGSGNEMKRRLDEGRRFLHQNKNRRFFSEWSLKVSSQRLPDMCATSLHRHKKSQFIFSKVQPPEWKSMDVSTVKNNGAPFNFISPKLLFYRQKQSSSLSGINAAT